MVKYNNGKFRIIQFADVQDTQFTSADSVNFIASAIDSLKPDLVVFSGDQVKSYGVNIMLGNPKANMIKTIRNILKPLEERNTPFTFVFGNHDVPKGMDRQWQTDVYESYPNCVNSECVARYNETDTMCLPVYSSDGSNAEIMLYLIDNCARREGGGNGVTDEQIDWLYNFNSEFTETNGNKPVPSYVFQHIPVYEMYEILREVPKGTKGAIEGNQTKRGHYYVITDEMAARGENMGENIACPGTLTEQFGKWVEMGNVKAAFFGHDHRNSFTGKLRGIDLCYTPGCGFNAYGLGMDRAVRVIDFTEGKEDYETDLVTYSDIMGRKIKNKVKYAVYRYAPSSVDEAMTWSKKAAPYAAGLAAVGVFSLIGKRKKK